MTQCCCCPGSKRGRVGRVKPARRPLRPHREEYTPGLVPVPQLLLIVSIHLSEDQPRHHGLTCPASRAWVTLEAELPHWSDMRDLARRVTSLEGELYELRQDDDQRNHNAPAQDAAEKRFRRLTLDAPYLLGNIYKGMTTCAPPPDLPLLQPIYSVSASLRCHAKRKRKRRIGRYRGDSRSVHCVGCEYWRLPVRHHRVADDTDSCPPAACGLSAGPRVVPDHD